MKVGVLGFGTVAAATVRKFIENREVIASKTASAIDIVSVATRSVARAMGHVPPGCEISADCWKVVSDPRIDVVIELIGGVELARGLVLRAIANGKHVITANKALLAMHGEEIMQLAEQRRVCVLFEGAVAVSIPIVKALKEAAAANRVTSVHGILNGTSNYILSRMSEHDASFADALAEAQTKGYAEADPVMDIEGIDAAHKIALLSSLAFGVPIDFEAVQYRGITGVAREDIALAKEMGYALRLIAQAQLQDNCVYTSVAPTLVPASSMLAQVRSSMNGIELVGDLFGRAFFYGSGAGGVQTASAILADLIELAQREKGAAQASVFNMGFRRAAIARKNIMGSDDRRGRFYLRMRVDDAVGVPASVRAILADAGVSLAELRQNDGSGASTDLAAITHTISWSRLRSALPKLQRLTRNACEMALHPVLDDAPEVIV
ncbi:homoserine dehydrogenase [Burkholderia vietnamiensis]|uniref:homoserine dehydrogenase n=1 Tax=Burkholderia vietnamiensis TaxID=60552 RepID=UPI0009BFC315|nr:homoserine dehydrogenase [Burkholderia vietnamiensis]